MADFDLSKIKEHIPGLVGEDYKFRAAVCIALMKSPSGYDILFEQRSSRVYGQPGDFCLPGGGMEPGETPMETAIREACEELLITPEQIEIIGRSDIFCTHSMIIYPFVCTINDYHNTFDDFEVARVFRIPLEFFMNSEPIRHDVVSHPAPEEDFPFDLVQGGRNYKWPSVVAREYFYQYEDKTIWGITASIIKAFCRIF